MELDKEGFGILVEEYLNWRLERNYSAFANTTDRMNLGYFVNWCSQRDLTRPSEVSLFILERYQRFVFRWRKKNGKPLKFSSQQTRLVPVKAFFKWLTKKHYIPYNPASELELPKRGSPLPAAYLTIREVARVLAVPDVKSFVGIRDRAVLETFYSTGIRRNELVNIRVDDLDSQLGLLTIRFGKGLKQRVVPIGKSAMGWIEKYLYDVRAGFVTGADEGELFLSSFGVKFNPAGLSALVRRYLNRAGIKKKGSCHLFRHTVATHMLENGADIRFIQEILGHSKLESTQIYTRVSIKQLKKVHSKTHPAESP